jgi:hypothetical protein
MTRYGQGGSAGSGTHVIFLRLPWRAWRGWGLCCFIQLLDLYIGIPSLEHRA